MPKLTPHPHLQPPESLPDLQPPESLSETKLEPMTTTWTPKERVMEAAEVQHLRQPRENPQGNQWPGQPHSEMEPERLHKPPQYFRQRTAKRIHATQRF